MKNDFKYGSVLKLTRYDTKQTIEAALSKMRDCGMNTVVVWPAAFYWEEQREGYPFNTGRLVLELAECYFDTFSPMNSPLKLTFEFACLGALLLTVNEMRVGLDQKRRGFHLFAATVASVFLPTSAIPSIICYLSGDMPASYVLVYSDLVMLGISVLAVARLVQLCFYEQAEPTESETEIQDSDEEQIEEQSSDSAEVQE